MIAAEWRALMATAQIVVETRADAQLHEVSRRNVPTDLLEDVERTVRMASRTLGLDPEPRVRWLPAETRGLRGVVFDGHLGEVWIKLQEPEATRDTALHEVRHVYQLRDERYQRLGLLTMEQRQQDADTFAATWSPWDAPALAPAGRQPVTETRSHQRFGGRPIWESKGVVYVECDRCWQGVPLNTLHSCPAGRRAASYHTRSARGGYHGGYAVKAL